MRIRQDVASPPRGLAENVSLAPLTTLGTGGAARYFVEARDQPTLITALAWANQRGLQSLVLGGGSNLVCSDDGFDGVVIQIALSGMRAERCGGLVEVTLAAGEDWDAFVLHSVTENWAGVECLSGIPGRVGATPIQNVGAYGQEVSDTLTRVVCLNRHSLEMETFSRAECQLGYRDSRFKRRDDGRYVVLSVSFGLVPGGAPKLAYGDLASRVGPNPTLTDVRDAVRRARREKSMLLDPNDADGRSCGSFFVNPVVTRGKLADVQRAAGTRDVPHHAQGDGRVKLPAAWLIEASGIVKGQRLGRAGISTKHALCIVAHPGATSDDVRELAVLVRDRVRQRFDIALEPEPKFVGFPPP